jgi:hypothetical protein
MKQNTIRIINSCGLVIAVCSVCIYNTVHHNNLDYQVHPVASIIGTIIPGIIVGFGFYWWAGWRARHKQKKSTSMTPQEAVRLIGSNINDQNADAINGFLRNASAEDIQEFVHNKPHMESASGNSN